MNVELFYVSGCPNRVGAAQMLKEVVIEFGLSKEIAEIKVADDSQALATRFLGSPTIRIDGKDVEPGITELRHFGLSCRIYLVNGTRQGVPAREWIRQAVLSAVLDTGAGTANRPANEEHGIEAF